MRAGTGEQTGRLEKMFASQLSGHINKLVVTRIIIDAIAIYAIVAVLG